MIRIAVVMVGLLLVGCGVVHVGERPIPPIEGAVASTAWEAADDYSAMIENEEPGLTSPEAYLAFIVAFAGQNGSGSEIGNGILSRAGNRAVAYLQAPNSDGRSPLIANEARLTLERRADGTWTLAALETREVCRVPLTDGACGDARGG